MRGSLTPFLVVGAATLAVAAGVAASCGDSSSSGSPATAAGGAGGTAGSPAGGFAGQSSGSGGAGAASGAGAGGKAGTSGSGGIGGYVAWLVDDAAWTEVNLGVSFEDEGKLFSAVKSELGRAPRVELSPCGPGCSYTATNWTTTGATGATMYYGPGGAPLIQLQNTQLLAGVFHQVARWVDGTTGDTVAAVKLRYKNNGNARPFMYKENPRFTGLVPNGSTQVVAGLGKNLQLAWSNPHALYTGHDWFVSDGEYPRAFVYNNSTVSVYRFPEKDPQALDTGGGIEAAAGWGDLGVWTKYSNGKTRLNGYAEDGKGVRVLLETTPVPDKTVKLCVSTKWIWGIAGSGSGGIFSSLKAWRIPSSPSAFTGTPDVFDLAWPEAILDQFSCGDDWIVVPSAPVDAVGIRWNIYQPGTKKAWRLIETEPTKVQFDSLCATNDSFLWVSRGEPFGTARMYRYELGMIDQWAAPLP